MKIRPFYNVLGILNNRNLAEELVFPPALKHVIRYKF